MARNLIILHREDLRNVDENIEDIESYSFKNNSIEFYQKADQVVFMDIDKNPIKVKVLKNRAAMHNKILN